ncbi:MAG: hypothetical protein R3E96_00545 [Planctomycetota bacterium]
MAGGLHWAALTTSCLLAGCSGGSDSAPLLLVDAGSDQTVDERTQVTLSASVSQNQGTPTYQWSQVSGQAVTLDDPTAANPTFTMTSVGLGATEDLVFQLTVTDGPGRSSQDTVTVHGLATDLMYFAAGSDHSTLNVWNPQDDSIELVADVGLSGSFYPFLVRNDRGQWIFASQPTDLDSDVIYRVDGIGQAPVALTTDLSGQNFIEVVELSPDGNFLAYVPDTDVASEQAVWVLDIRDGARVKVVDFTTEPRPFAQMQWASDSSALVIELSYSPGGRLIAYDPLTQISLNLTQDPTGSAFVGSAAWYLVPGTHDVYVLTDEERSGQRELFRTSLDGLVWERLTADPVGSGMCNWFQVSPDASKVAYYSSELDGTVNRLFVIGADGTGRSLVDPGLEPNTHTGSDFFWTPDSSRVLLTGLVAGTSTYNLFSALPDGTGAAVICPSVQASGECQVQTQKLSFTADGKVLFMATIDNAFDFSPVLAATDGSQEVLLGADLPVDTEGIRLYAGNRRPEILMQTGSLTGGHDGVYRVQPDGTGLERLDLVLGGPIGIFDEAESPDHSRLFFCRNTDTPGRGMQVASSDGTAFSLDALELPMASGVVVDWHPDSDLFAFTFSHAGGVGLRVVNAATGEITSIYSDSSRTPDFVVWVD